MWASRLCADVGLLELFGAEVHSTEQIVLPDCKTGM